MTRDSMTREELTDALIKESERLLQEAKELQAISMAIEEQIKKRGAVVGKAAVTLSHTS